jgi:hypothetical protein
MQPQSEISILDWLREKLHNPRELLREWRSARKPAQTESSAPDEPVSVLQTGEPDSTPVVSLPAQTAESPERAPILAVETVETIETQGGTARVAINAEIPHGTTLTITIRADSQGQVSVEKQTKDTQPVWRKLQTQPGKQIQLGENVHALKASLAKAGGFLGRLMAPVAKLSILRNGLVFILLGLVAAFLADSQVREARAFTEAALLPLAWAGVLFALGTWVIHHREASLLKDAPAVGIFGFLAEKRQRNIALVLIGAALVLTFWVTQDSVGGGNVNASWLLNRWALAILLVCVAAWLVQEKTNSEQNTNNNNKWLLAGVAAIIVLAFGLRIWQLGDIPFTLGGDEGEQGVEVLRVLGGQLTNPFITGWYGVPTLSFFFNAPSVALFGNTIFGIRVIWVLVGTASVLSTYLLVKELKGTRLALMSAALVATYHYHLHYSRLGSNQISDTLLVSLSLLFLVRGYLRGKWLDWALAGVVVGIGQYFYAGGRLAIVLSLFLLAYLWVRDGFKITRINRVGVGIFLIALLVAGGPMFGYAVNFPDQYNTRTNQIGILQNGWLVNEAIILEKNQEQVLLDQFWRASLAFNAYPDRVPQYYGLDGPLLEQAAGVLFILGILSATLWSIRNRRLAPMVAWWWAAILTGGMLTDTTPSSQRLITASIPTMFFIAWAIEHFVAALRQQISKPVGLTMGILATLVLSISSINLYFNDYNPRHIFGGEHAMIGTMISKQVLEDLGEDTQIYFLGAPRMYAGIGTMRYLMPEIRKFDVEPGLESPFVPDPLPEAQNLLFIFLPERLGELEWVRQTFPGGQLADVASITNPDKVLYSIYTVKNSLSP